MSTAALIVAAGRGTRAGGGLPKQWRALAGQRMIDHTLARFETHPRVDHVVVVLHPDDMHHAAGFRANGHLIVSGGADRAGSVRNGLETLTQLAPERVLIHDAARPCVSAELIDRVIDALDHADGAAPALMVTDALWTGADDQVTGTQDRSGLYRAQTPQGFHFDTIRAAHAAHNTEAADDVEVARAAGIPVAIVPGEADNLKVTQAADFDRAARILGEQMDIRLGNGFDVHKFTAGDAVILCGVSIPFDRALLGHSDADVGMHAVTDAIYGALAEGDIGQHFPPSDPQWKGAASDIFLRHAVALAAEKGFRINNIDCTLICEAPKIGPHSAAMRARMGEIMGLRADQVSIKATTSEQLGFTGRGEGIAALASATLVPA